MLRLTVAFVGFALLGLGSFGSAQAGSEIVTLGLDMETAGNGPRSAGQIDQCGSIAVGQPATVDVVVPEPGIPAGRGISAYQFTLFYDSTVVSVTGDNPVMLLHQALGSALIPLSDPKPDTDGVYTSGVVDFGPKGVEPVGASEVGPGVLARLTLTPRAAGVSPLVIKDVIIKDDSGDDIEIISVLAAYLYTGEPCSGQAAVTPTATPARTPAGTRTPPPAARGGAAAPSPAGLAQTGGRAGEDGAHGVMLVLAGATGIAAGAGITLLAAGRGKRL